METTKKKLKKEIDNVSEEKINSYPFSNFYNNVKAIVSRMPDDKVETKPETQAKIEMKKYDTLQKIIEQLEFCDYQTKDGLHSLRDNIAFCSLKLMADKSETKPEPSLLEVAMNLKCNYKTALSIRECFESAEKLIAENERRKNGK